MGTRYAIGIAVFMLGFSCACTPMGGLSTSNKDGNTPMELVVSANDGKQLERGQGPQNRTPDSVAVIDFTHYPPKTLGIVAAPAGLVGPPVSVAVSRDQRLALVTASGKVDPSDVTKLVPDDSLSVVDISSPAHPRVTQSLHTGLGAEGVAINQPATLALVTNTNEGTVSVFSIAGGKLTPAGKINLDAGSRPASAEFLPDGKTALVVCLGSSKIARLLIDGANVTKAGEITLDAKSASLALPVQGGHFAIVNGTGPPPANGAATAARGTTRDNKVSIVDLSSGKIVTTTDIGAGDEYIGLSPDGVYLEATVTNGSHNAPTAPDFHDFGLMKVFRVSDASIIPVAEVETGHWCQGAIWSNDNRTILLQCATEKEIEVFHFDGKVLSRDQSATIKFDADPSGIATATSH